MERVQLEEMVTPRLLTKVGAIEPESAKLRFLMTVVEEWGYEEYSMTPTLLTGNMFRLRIMLLKLDQMIKNNPERIIYET